MPHGGPLLPWTPTQSASPRFLGGIARRPPGSALRKNASMKSLLRQPGGFKGLVPVGQLVPNYLPVPNGEDAANLRIDVHAAGSPRRPNPAQRDHGLPRVDDSVDPDRVLLKGIEEGHPGLECLGPVAVCIRVGQPGRAEHHLTMVVVQLPSARPLVLLLMLQDVTHDLHVLLRHRQLSIAEVTRKEARCRRLL